MKNKITLVLCLLCGTLPGQNLVPNNGFDVYTSCPNNSSQVNLTPPWGNVNNVSGTPDYMNACFTGGNQGVPTNFYGFQQPVSGGGYYGIITHYAGGQEVREYLMVPLITPLVANTTYTIGFHASLSDNFGWATDHLGVHVSVGPLSGTGGFSALPFVPQIDHPTGTILSDMINWTQVSGTYTAMGGETHITIGNFFSDPNTLITNVNPSGLGWAYYYIDEVFVIPSPNIQITGTSQICLGDSAILTASNDSVFAWADSLNPSVILDTDSVLTILPTVTTTYFVYGSTDTASFTVQVIIPPSVNLGNDTTLCPGESIALNAATPGATYLWQDNSTDSTLSITQQGTYWVEVTLNNCSTIDSIQVNYTTLPAISIGNDSTLCQGETLILNATTSGATYLWNDNSTNATYAVSQPGTYWVEVTINSCTIVDSVTINYNPLPVINLGNDLAFCDGDSVVLNATTLNGSYLWQDNSVLPTHTVSQQGTYWVEVTVNNCSASDTINVVVTPVPIVSLGNDTTLCQGQTLVLNASTAGAAYLWNDNSTNPTFTVTQPGSYWVEVSVNNCSALDSVVVTYNPSPVINLGNDISLCQGETFTLNAATPNASYLWSDNSTNDTYTISQQGVYWVQVTVNNCSTTDSLTATYTPLPVVDLGIDTTLCQDEPITLDLTTPGASYLWQDNSTNATFTITQPGSYWIEVTVNNCSAADTIVVDLMDCEILLEIPNIFTPNGDGKNDTFHPIVMKGILKTELLIFNRWGQSVHETNDLLKGWDGNKDGSQCSDATYFWIINYTTIRNEQKSINGVVKLVR